MRWLLDGRRLETRDALILGALTTAMLLTRSRTAAIATALGFVAAVLGGRSMGTTRQSSREVARAAGLMLILAAAMFGLQFAGGHVSSSVSGFLLKNGGEHLGEAFAASRGYGIRTQWHNFMTAPLIGHGFGVFADGHFDAGVRTVAGIPISAPVEKGFLPSAVLEETGLLGGALFAYLTYVLAHSVWRRTSRPMVAILFTSLFVNFGEAILLSPGGMGLHVWLLIGLAAQSAASSPASESRSAPRARAPRLIRRFANLID